MNALLAADFTADDPGETAAIQRVTDAWREALAAPRPEPAAARTGARPWSLRRWMTASAAVAVPAALLAVAAITAPTRALGSVASAMARVERFHLRIEFPDWHTRYEGWGQKGVGARLEEWEGDHLTQVFVDDGQTLRSYDPERKIVRESGTRLKELYRQAAGFNGTRMLRQAARGKLFEGQDWLGEAAAREVARVVRNGVPQRRIQVDLKDGFFERMIIYAELDRDRLTQANLYTDSNSPDEEPTARVFFDYPEQIDPARFRFQKPKGAVVRQETIRLP